MTPIYHQRVEVVCVDLNLAGCSYAEELSLQLHAITLVVQEGLTDQGDQDSDR